MFKVVLSSGEHGICKNGYLLMCFVRMRAVCIVFIVLTVAVILSLASDHCGKCDPLTLPMHAMVSQRPYQGIATALVHKITVYRILCVNIM